MDQAFERVGGARVLVPAIIPARRPRVMVVRRRVRRSRWRFVMTLAQRCLWA